ncbi:hypothetical protein ID866_6966 [Astraeus odoratus]|nr:hypothetical protein ID866_6966 [Astraeus odoratus]
MDQLTAFEALLFPSDGRNPHMVALMTSPSTMQDPHAPYSGVPVRVPHPEVYMDYIAEGLGHRAWKYHLVEALDYMNKKFTHPYVVFYPVISRDGMPFPINKCIREIQGRFFREECAWRGNIIVAKYRESPFSSMVNGSIADFPILRNYFMTHGAPGAVSSPANQAMVNMVLSTSQ